MGLTTELKNEVASIGKDITQPIFGGILHHHDDTLLTRGGGRGIRIYDDIERDCHAFAVLQKRKMAVIAREWKVDPASSSRIDKKAADLVRDQLSNLSCDTPDDEVLPSITGFDAACLALMDAHLKGFAVGEIMWSTDGSQIVASEVRPKSQRRFEFVPGNIGYKLMLKTWSNLLPGEPVPPRKFIVHSFGSKDGNPYGLGLGSRLFWPVLFKRQDITFWLSYIDKFAGPTAIGKYPSGASPADKTTLLNALSSIATEAGIIVPDGMAIDFLEAARSGSIDSYEKMARYMDEQISEAVLGETGSTNQSNGGGSRARDQVGNEVRLELVKADADMLSGTINCGLVKWITQLNLPGANPPKVWREMDEPADLKSQSERDGTLTEKCGVRFSTAYFEREYGFQDGDIESVVAVSATLSTAARDGAQVGALLPAAATPETVPASFADPVENDTITKLVDHQSIAADPVMTAWVKQLKTTLEAAEMQDMPAAILDAFPGLPVEEMARILAEEAIRANMAGRLEAKNGF